MAAGRGESRWDAWRGEDSGRRGGGGPKTEHVGGLWTMGWPQKHAPAAGARGGGFGQWKIREECGGGVVGGAAVNQARAIVSARQTTSVFHAGRRRARRRERARGPKGQKGHRWGHGGRAMQCSRMRRRPLAPSTSTTLMLLGRPGSSRRRLHHQPPRPASSRSGRPSGWPASLAYSHGTWELGSGAWGAGGWSAQKRLVANHSC